MFTQALIDKPSYLRTGDLAGSVRRPHSSTRRFETSIHISLANLFTLADIPWTKKHRHSKYGTNPVAHGRQRQLTVVSSMYNLFKHRECDQFPNQPQHSQSQQEQSWSRTLPLPQQFGVHLILSSHKFCGTLMITTILPKKTLKYTKIVVIDRLETSMKFETTVCIEIHMLHGQHSRRWISMY